MYMCPLPFHVRCEGSQTLSSSMDLRQHASLCIMIIMQIEKKCIFHYWFLEGHSPSFLTFFMEGSLGSPAERILKSHTSMLNDPSLQKSLSENR